LKHLTFYKHADNAQQAFSSEQTSTLQLAIPALEALHRAWSSRAERLKYERFADALESACTKVDEYYEKTTESPAYIMAMSMLLHPALCVDATNMTASPQSKRKDDVFQEALVNGTPGRSHEMRRRSGM
jgi:hypothetical protein